MGYCGPLGMPLSQFLAWDELDQDAAMAWQSQQRETCPGCNTRRAEWDPERGGERHPYVPLVDVCPGCSTLDRGRDDLKGRSDVAGARIVLVSRHDPRAHADLDRRRTDAAERGAAARAEVERADAEARALTDSRTD